MYLLEKICKELGVELGEEWVGVGVHTNPPKYTITDNTLWIYHKYKSQDNSKWEWKEASMADYVSLIKGELKPKWKPKEGEIYYFPYIHSKEEERCVPYRWEKGCKVDKFRWENNLVFKTDEDAIEAANKMLNVLREE